MNIKEKYQNYRLIGRNGDLFFTHGKSLLAKTIRLFDKSYINHAGLVYTTEMAGETRFMVCDSNAKGAKPEFMSSRMSENEDFIILRPIGWTQNEIDKAVNKAIDEAESGLKYDTLLLLQIAMHRATGIKTHWGKDNKDICSEFARRYTRHLPQSFAGVQVQCFEKPTIKTDFITPWDFIIYHDDIFYELICAENIDFSKFRKR